MILRVRDGSFCYPDGRLVLSGINFFVESGEILSVLGANGAGKTTLMRCMLGLASWSEGRTELDGIDLRNLKSRAFWKRVGYVPQARAMPLSCTVAEMVVLGRNAQLGLFAQPAKSDWAAAKRALDLLDLAHLRDRLCSRLSGGELQMVLVARALAGEPELLVLDEPESNLDFRNQRLVLESIARVCRQRHLAAIFNTHYPDHALELSDKALLLSAGKADFGSTAAILTEERLSAALGIPVCIREVVTPGGPRLCVMPSGGRETLSP